MLGPRLATIHNLTFFSRLMSEARKAIQDGCFGAWRSDFLTSWQEA
jgi:queuine tRNA-ribosyltransferase